MGTGVVWRRFYHLARRTEGRTSILPPPFKNYYILHPPYHTTSSTSTPSRPHTAPPVAPQPVRAVPCTRDGGHSTTYGNICKSVQVSASDRHLVEVCATVSCRCSWGAGCAPYCCRTSCCAPLRAPCGVYRHPLPPPTLRTFQAHYGVTSCTPCAPALGSGCCTGLVRSLQAPLLHFVTPCRTDTACTCYSLHL